MKLEHVTQAQRYLRRVIKRADHHAQEVVAVIPVLFGGLLCAIDDASLEVMTHKGRMANALWFHVNGQRYAVSYAHRRRAIEVRRGSLQGKRVASFTNDSTSDDVTAFLRRLSRRRAS